MKYGFIIFFLVAVTGICPGQSEVVTCESSESLGELDAGNTAAWPWLAVGIGAGLINFAGTMSEDQSWTTFLGVSAAVVQMGGLITGCVWPRSHYPGPQERSVIAECHRAGYVRWAEWRNIAALYLGRAIPVVVYLVWVVGL